MERSNLVFTGLVVQESDEFVAYCTELDVVSQGETVKEAKEMLQEAIGLYLNTCVESNLPYMRPIPHDEDPRNETPADVVEVYRIKVDVNFRVYA
jgi:predicted RNase H-like HicB family nuclease